MTFQAAFFDELSKLAEFNPYEAPKAPTRKGDGEMARQRFERSRDNTPTRDFDFGLNKITNRHGHEANKPFRAYLGLRTRGTTGAKRFGIMRKELNRFSSMSDIPFVKAR